MAISNIPIYLDNQSTTKVDDRVLNAMLPYFADNYGNPSSDSLLGIASRTAITEAKRNISDLINSSPSEIFFTSGATEAIGWAIRGVVEKGDNIKKEIIVSSIEHSAVLKTCDFFEKNHQFKIIQIRPNADGIIDPEDVQKNISPKTLLVVIQHANNEIGTIQPIRQIGVICRNAGILLLVDAAQSLGKIDCDVKDMEVDFLAASGHKLYAPKGVGFLYIRENAKDKINPVFYGGGQESGYRSGTQNVPYIVALGEACKISKSTMCEESERLISFRDLFIEEITSCIPEIVINGCLKNRLPGNINFSVPGIINNILISNLINISISKGSACNAFNTLQSHVLSSISEDDNIIKTAIRIGIGRFNTLEEVVFAAKLICQTINEIKFNNSEFN